MLTLRIEPVKKRERNVWSTHKLTKRTREQKLEITDMRNYLLPHSWYLD